MIQKGKEKDLNNASLVNEVKNMEKILKTQET